jgi:hypothetical protein
MEKVISISKDSEFFIALCTEKTHSYITLGVKNGSKIALLAAIGKSVGVESSQWGFYLWDTSAMLGVENILFKVNSSKKPISYKAYSISYENYVQFLCYLKMLSLKQTKDQKEPPIRAYCPDLTNPAICDLKYQSVENISSTSTLEDEAVVKLYQKIGGRSNNCRHAAIQLTQKATHLHDLGRGISSYFFLNPPLKAVFSSAKIDEETTPYFYILPPPPNSFASMSADQLKIVNELYKRLDKLILNQQDNPVTFNKFSKLKALYNNITSNYSASILDILRVIVAFELENKPLIATHRCYHWFSFQTATEKMFAAFHQELETLQKATCSQEGQVFSVNSQ